MDLMERMLVGASERAGLAGSEGVKEATGRALSAVYLLRHDPDDHKALGRLDESVREVLRRHSEAAAQDGKKKEEL